MATTQERGGGYRNTGRCSCGSVHTDAAVIGTPGGAPVVASAPMPRLTLHLLAVYKQLKGGETFVAPEVVVSTS